MSAREAGGCLYMVWKIWSKCSPSSIVAVVTSNSLEQRVQHSGILNIRGLIISRDIGWNQPSCGVDTKYTAFLLGGGIRRRPL